MVHVTYLALGRLQLGDWKYFPFASCAAGLLDICVRMRM